MKKHLPLLTLLLAATLTLAACLTTADAAARAAEAYLNALVEKDLNRMLQASCGSWETQARFELETFAGVETRVEGLACTISNQGDGSAGVACSGEIVAAYGAEDRTFPLDGRVFQMQQQGGLWLVCGAE